MPESLMEMRDVTSGYGDIRVLRDLSLTVWAGRCTLLLGRNGAGKSTTLLTAAGLLRAVSGEVVVQGRTMGSTPAHQRVRGGLALVQENKRVFKRRSVEHNLALGGYAMPRRDRRAAIERSYERFPILKEKHHLPAGALSGGQQQMLAIAQALMPEPSVMMLDEPSAGLAPSIVNDVMRTVRQLKEEGIGVLLVEQLVDKAMSVADHVVLLEHGRVMLSSAASEMVAETAKATYLGKNQKPLADSSAAG